MNILLALFFLGLLQGLTEFLPVSSSGHLVLFSKIFGVEESLFLSILLHVATLLSICVIFWRDLWQMIRHPFSNQTMQLVVATIPTCIIVLILMPIIKQSFMGGALPVCFAITAVLLCLSEFLSIKKGLSCSAKKLKFQKKKKAQSQNIVQMLKPEENQKQADIQALQDSKTEENAQSINFKTAFWMGVAQGFAVFPGISRSGSTISAGLLNGKNKKEVAKFSFLMSIPVILLSLVMEVYDVIKGGVQISFPIWAIVLSFVAAFLVGIFAIKWMIKLTEKSSLKWFSAYLVVISIVSLFLI